MILPSPGREQARRTIFAEDLEVGAEYDLGTYLITAEEIVDFASSWDPQVFHVDHVAARDSFFGHVVASGIHTLAVFQKLTVESHLWDWNIMAGRGIRDVRFRRPVSAGDRLSGRFVLDQLNVDSRGRAAVTSIGTLDNQNGHRVLEVITEALIQSQEKYDQIN
ncbi:MaoC/PaaZ C-terminal domain-containing protein [Rhodococcus sp. NPDC059968]|uniref:MaoC/PaaZ C-terminal domain-containing protein n=1 Tax=Rhodococcus sp. NPDC059968 TaxID=3347017 RepID=UPI003671EA4C